MDAEVEVVNIVSDDINKTYYENPYYNPRYYQRFIFQGSPDINALKPLYFMVYCDIISPCIVGSNYANLLKICGAEVVIFVATKRPQDTVLFVDT